MRVLAVAETDSFVKWAAWTLERWPAAWAKELAVVGSAVAPSGQQIADAVAGTQFAAPARITLRDLRRQGPATGTDVVLLACTGPTVAALSLLLATQRRRPVVACGIPGIAVPVAPRAIAARRLVDVFIAHSIDERDRFEAAFATDGAATTVALSRLPFLHGPDERAAPDDAPVVFAAQPSVPATRGERIAVLEQLAMWTPPPIVKVRARAVADRMTHHEPHPYEQLWRTLVDAGRVAPGAVQFAGGSFDDVLSRSSAVATVSSTAALEAIDRGRPVTIVDDFGVSDELLNAVFVGSGLVGPLANARTGARPDRGWAQRHYFHDPGLDDVAGTLASTVAQRRVLRRRAVDGAFAKAAVRGTRRLLARGRR